MAELTAPHRCATGDDAAAMAELVNIAGDGLPLYLWGTMAGPGQSAWDVGLERARSGLGGFAFHNTVVREVQGRVAACLIGYSAVDTPAPSTQAMPAPLVPLQALQRMAGATWYLNVLATYPEYRGRGIATELLHIAEARAREAQCKTMSLIMSEANKPARRLYEQNGFAERARQAIIKGGWVHDGREWVLMVREL